MDMRATPAPDLDFLFEKSRQLREDIIRMIVSAGSGHPGGSLSAIDVVTYLYYHLMRVDPKDPRWEDRDRFILSKGHDGPAQYAALADRGYFPRETLATLRDIGSILQGHPDMNKTPGIDMTTGSLGQGLSAGVGMALGGKLRRKDFRVYVMLGDGEIQSGQVWEAAMAAGQWKLDNLTAIVDDNRLQCDGPTRSIMDVEPIDAKFAAFGWDTTVIDGHDFAQIDRALRLSPPPAGKPKLVVAHTVKGKGVSYMEDSVPWHGACPDGDQAAQAYDDIRRMKR